jgi:hypothetical protein
MYAKLSFGLKCFVTSTTVSPPSPFGEHNGGIGVSGAHLEVGYPLIVATSDAAILCSPLLKPIMTLFIVLGECFLFFLGK